MSAPKVSVVVPLYNRVKFLPQLFYSLQHQDFSDFELVLVDDGSDDGAADWIEQKKNTVKFNIVYKWQENGGPYVARNTGLRMAKGKLIALYDSDDEWPAHHLSTFVKHMDNNLDIDFLFASIKRINHEDRKVLEKTNFELDTGDKHPVIALNHELREMGTLKVITDERLAETAIAYTIPGSTQCTIIRKKVFDSFKFDESFRTAYDRFFTMKLALAGFKFAYIDEQHLIYHVHDDNISTVKESSAEKLNRSAKTMLKGYQSLFAYVRTKSQRKALNKKISKVYAWELAMSFQQLGEFNQAKESMKNAIKMYPLDWRYYKSFLASLVRAKFVRKKKHGV